jgi:hypothetical protein
MIVELHEGAFVRLVHHQTQHGGTSHFGFLEPDHGPCPYGVLKHGQVRPHPFGFYRFAVIKTVQNAHMQPQTHGFAYDCIPAYAKQCAYYTCGLSFVKKLQHALYLLRRPRYV